MASAKKENRIFVTLSTINPDDAREGKRKKSRNGCGEVLRYQLHEYHFHIPGEHRICGKTFAAEVHFTFVQLRDDEDHLDILPGANVPGDRNLFVISRVINGGGEPTNLSLLQVSIPSTFYQYNATKSFPDYNPVRWLIGPEPLCFDLQQLIPIAHGATPIQPTNGRIVLYTAPQ